MSRFLPLPFPHSSSSVPFPGPSRRSPPLGRPPLLLITTYCYCAHLRPPHTPSVSALKGITAIVATERGSGACHYATSAADSVTVLPSFARGVDPKVKSVTGAQAVAAPLVMTLLWRRHSCERSARIMAEPTDPPASHPILLPHRGTVLGMALARSDEMAFLWSFHCPLHSFGRIGQTCLCPPLRLALLRSGIGTRCRALARSRGTLRA